MASKECDHALHYLKLRKPFEKWSGRFKRKKSITEIRISMGKVQVHRPITVKNALWYCLLGITSSLLWIASFISYWYSHHTHISKNDHKQFRISWQKISQLIRTFLYQFLYEKRHARIYLEAFSKCACAEQTALMRRLSEHVHFALDPF